MIILEFTRIAIRAKRPVLAAVAAGLLACPAAQALASDQAPGAGASPDQKLKGWSLEQLLNIDITTVSKSAQKEFEAPGVVSVLTQDEIQRFGGTTLADLLIRIPGLVGSGVYMTDRSIVSPRGDQIRSASSNVLLLINGRPVREVLEGGIKSEFLESFPIDVIERIEVVKGPGSVLYGSNAMDAVINIITKTPERSGVSVAGTVGGDGAFSSAATATVKSGDLGVIAGVAYHKKSDWETTYLTKPDLFAPASVTNRITIPNEGPGAYLGANYKGFRLSAAYAEWDNSFFLTDFNSVGGANWTKRFGDVGYGHQVTPKWKTDFDLTYSRSTFEVDAFPSVTRDSREIVAEWTNSVELPHGSQLVFGGLYNQMSGAEVFHGAPVPVNISDAQRWSMAGYAQVDYRLVDRLKLIGGFQVNKIESRDVNVVPRLGVIWQLPKGFYAKALYAEAFRAPSINELSLNHPALQGNANLKPEQLANFDLSIGYQAGRGQVTASYFHNKQTDIIVQDRTTVPGHYANLGEAKIDGFELEGKLYASKQLYLSGSILYHNTRDPQGYAGVTPIAAFSAKTGVSYQWDGGHVLSLFNAYQGDIDRSLTGSRNPQPGPYNLLYLHGRFDLSRALKLKGSQRVSLLLQADNLLNKEVWLPLWGMLPGESMPSNQGRAAYVGVSATF
jgi:outer membrane receptor for ferrienterochelin and colicins